jgi:hypothetical protein
MTNPHSVLNCIKKRFHIVLLILVVFGVYISTLLRGIGYSGDTTKFQFVGKVLGTAHEPGAPGYTMLNYLFVTIFPWGSYSFKANLLSAMCATAAIIVLFYLLQRLSVRRSTAFFVSLTFAFTYTFWSQAVIAEVYALNILFVGLTLFFFIRWHQTLIQRDFFIGCTIYALSFGTHLSMIAFLPALLFLVWKTRKEYFWNVRVLACVFLIILIGAAQYGYLFWRTYAQDTTYLEITVSDFKDLWYYVRGGQFQDKLTDSSLSKIIYLRMPVILRLAWLEYSVLLPAAIFGFYLIRNNSLRVFLILCAVGIFVLTCLYGIPDIFVYVIPVYYLLALTLGISLEWIASRCKAQYLTLFQLSLVCMPCLFLTLNYQKADQSGNLDAKVFVEQSLKTIGRKSLIICPDYDWGEFFWYYVFAENFQQDSVYVYYPHNAEMPVKSLESYVSHAEPFYLPVQRCYVPAGLTVYYCTAFEERSFDRSRFRYPHSTYRFLSVSDPAIENLIEDGFRFVQVGSNMYRIDRPLP